MNEERALTILLNPHVSEKAAYAAGSHRQYAFKVIKDAAKPEIKSAVERLFNVKVSSVRVCNMKTKPKRFGRTMGRTKAWKKAYVSLAEGQSIELTDKV